ncbi:hypothetical protein HYQ44_006322 [Verticillium longisporum]|nr:hypothetical protein HYQ44_006322 [Verticillium longisporum]
MIVHPGQPLLNGLDLETDRAEDDVLDGLDEDCAVENRLETSRHAIGERVERVVDRACGLSHPAEKIVVDIILGREHHAVGAISPLLGYRSQAADNVLGEFADLVGQLRHGAFDGLEQDKLAQAGKEAGERERKHKERGERRRVEAPAVAARCGFCDARMASWPERVEHLARHFKAGALMQDWVGEHGLSDLEEEDSDEEEDEDDEEEEEELSTEKRAEILIKDAEEAQEEPVVQVKDKEVEALAKKLEKTGI